jgi:hypothetical protein
LTETSLSVDLNVVPSGTGRVPCGTPDFTARFKQVGDDWYFVAAVGEKFTSSTKLEQTGDGYRATGVGGGKPVLRLPIPCEYDVVFTEVTFTELANDASGNLVGFVANGLGKVSDAEYSSSNREFPHVFDVTIRLSGEPDTAAPRMAIPGYLAMGDELPIEVHPFDDVELPFSEPIRVDTVPELLDQHGASWQIHARAPTWLDPPPGLDQVADGAFWRYSVHPVFRFDLAFTFEHQGTDLAGNHFQHTVRFRTPDDPGFLPPDGFETDVPGLSSSVIAFDTVSPISGARSLKIEGDANVTFHLKGGPNGRIRFKAQNMRYYEASEDYDEDYKSLLIEVGHADGTGLQRHQMFPEEPNGSALPVHEVVMGHDLPDQDVIIRFRLDPCLRGTRCVEIGARVDELWVE